MIDDMKQHLALFFVSLFAVLGCGKEMNDTVTSHPVSRFCATTEDLGSATKVMVSPRGVFDWKNGDKISVFDNTNANYKFIYDGDVFSKDGGGSITPGQYAVFPYGSGSSVNNNELVVELPGTYDLTFSNRDWLASMPMVGTIDGEDIRFKNIGAILLLTIYNVPSDATTLTFIAPNNKISGLFTKADASVSTPSISTSASGGVNNQLVFSFTRKKNMTFYIPLPVGTINGFSISFNDAGNTTKTVSKDISLERNSIVIAPELNLGASTAWVQHPEPTSLITQIEWNGMYSPGDHTTYTFSYDDQNRLTSFSINEPKSQFDYDDINHAITWREFDLSGEYKIEKQQNTSWLYQLSPTPAKPSLPFLVYNSDGTLSRMCHNYLFEDTTDSVWDENHNMTDWLGYIHVDYSDTTNIYTGVSINAFLLSWPPGSPTVNDEIMHMHTAKVPKSIKWLSGSYKDQTTSFNLTLDSNGRITSGELNGGPRQGQSFTVTYNN